MKFNVNNYIKVKISDYGEELLRLDHDKSVKQLWEIHPRLAMREEGNFTLPIEDEEGYSKMQMWHFMAIFGKHIYLGCELPFETTVEILENE